MGIGIMVVILYGSGIRVSHVDYIFVSHFPSSPTCERNSIDVATTDFGRLVGRERAYEAQLQKHIVLILPGIFQPLPVVVVLGYGHRLRHNPDISIRWWPCRQRVRKADSNIRCVQRGTR